MNDNPQAEAQRHSGPRSDDIEPQEKIGYSSHFVFMLCAAVFLAFGIWSVVSTLDIVSMATGEVVPSTQVKTVQHLEGGIVREILVKEGETVKAGQSLVVLEPTTSGADVGELQVRLTFLRIEIARLEAQTQGLGKPRFDTDLIATHGEQVRQAEAFFKARRSTHRNQIAKQKLVISQHNHEINEINARIRNNKQNLAMVQEQVAISEDLLRKDLTNRYTHLELLKEKSNLSGGIDEDASALNRAKASQNEAKATLQDLINIFDQDNRQNLDEAYATFRELSQRMQKFGDSLKRTIVRSPVDGIMKTLYMFTVGGVLRPGDAVADIVPGNDRLIIEAQLPTTDIGYVSAGQLATLKLASADAMRFGHINGEVLRVSPDALVNPEGMPFYKVLIAPQNDHFEKKGQRYNLFPGMQIMVSIHTGNRTVFDYLTGPLRTSMDDAFHER